jgi:hypothetical protein
VTTFSSVSPCLAIKIWQVRNRRNHRLTLICRKPSRDTVPLRQAGPDINGCAIGTITGCPTLRALQCRSGHFCSKSTNHYHEFQHDVTSVWDWLGSQGTLIASAYALTGLGRTMATKPSERGGGEPSGVPGGRPPTSHRPRATGQGGHADRIFHFI